MNPGAAGPTAVMFSATAEAPAGTTLVLPSGAVTWAPTTWSSMRWLTPIGRPALVSVRSVKPGDGRPWSLRNVQAGIRLVPAVPVSTTSLYQMPS